jgi:hypothetical protein
MEWNGCCSGIEVPPVDSHEWLSVVCAVLIVRGEEEED